jgi:hypothetical protein
MTVSSQTQADINRRFVTKYIPENDLSFKLSDSIYRTLKKTQDSFGDNMFGLHTLSMKGSVSSSAAGVIPQASPSFTNKPSFTPKNAYGGLQIDNKTLKNSERGGLNSTRSLFDTEVKETTTSFNYNLARMFFNDGSGVLAQFTISSAPTTPTAISLPAWSTTYPTGFRIVVQATGRYGRRKFHLEPNFDIAIGLGAAAPPYNTPALPTRFKIIAYNSITGELDIARVTGSDLPTTLPNGTYNIYMWDSQNSDFTGLLGACFDPTFNNVPVRHRYQPFTVPGLTNGNANAALDFDHLTNLFDHYQSETGENFDRVVMSPLQYRKFRSALADRTFNIQNVKVESAASSGKLKATVGISGVKVAGLTGDALIQEHNLVRDDMVIMLNSSKHESRWIEYPVWQVPPGGVKTTFVPGTDTIAMQYGGYGDNIINPFHVGFITGLTL